MRKVFEWIDTRGRGVISDWNIQEEQRAKLDQKIHMLRKAEIDPVTRVTSLPPQLLAGPNIYGQSRIYKLKVKGRVALRPFLALDQNGDWVFLERAVERDGRYEPPAKTAAATAETRRLELIADPSRKQILLAENDE